MTDKELLRINIQNQKNLEKRIAELEEQVALLLRAMRRLTEEAAQRKDPNFRPAEIPKA